jgi:hypothetical protein
MLSLTRHFHQFNKAAMLLAMLIVVFTLAGTVTPAFADSPVVNGTITSGSLSESAGATYSFTGTPGSTITYTMPFTANDLTGAHVGWKLSITSTTLTGSAGTLPNNASTILGTTASCSVNGTCSDATLTNSITGAVPLPAASTAPSAVQFFGTNTNTGAGTYTVTPTISVVLPGGLAAGGLSSVVTLTIAAGP